MSRIEAGKVELEDMTIDDVVGDELGISQVIINFLSNAVKFTSEGEVSVTFRQMFWRSQETVRKPLKALKIMSLVILPNASYGGDNSGMLDWLNDRSE